MQFLRIGDKIETPVYEKFLQQIRFDGDRYEVTLPWKEHYLPLPDHCELCHKRLDSFEETQADTPPAQGVRLHHP